MEFIKIINSELPGTFSLCIFVPEGLAEAVLVVIVTDVTLLLAELFVAFVVAVVEDGAPLLRLTSDAAAADCCSWSFSFCWSSAFEI